ncbi:MAG: hypothetical protein V3U78_06600, partial [Thiotrichaceae bacterium]
MCKSKQYTRNLAGLIAIIPLLVFITSCSTTHSASLEIAKEYPKPNEDKTTQGLVDALTQSIVEKYKNTTMLRDAHPKHHAC